MTFCIIIKLKLLIKYVNTEVTKWIKKYLVPQSIDFEPYKMGSFLFCKNIISPRVSDTLPSKVEGRNVCRPYRKL